MLPLERLQKLNTKENLWIYILLLLKERTPTHPPPSHKWAPIYGWELRSLIEKKFNFRSGLITPYRVLYRLENDGFVKSKMEDRKRIYQITKKGELELEKAKNFYRQILTQI